MATLQEIVNRVLGVGTEFGQADIEKNIAQALIQQGTAPKGALMQDKFIDAISSSGKVIWGFETNVYVSIVRKLHDGVVRYGERAYPLSEKQIAIVARTIADARMRYATTNCKAVGDEFSTLRFQG